MKRVRSELATAFFAQMGAADYEGWRGAHGPLTLLADRLGLAVSMVEALRPEEADFDIDGEVSIVIPRKAATVSLTHETFVVCLGYHTWLLQGVLLPQQLVRVGSTSIVEYSVSVDDEAALLRWIEPAQALLPALKPAEA